ncbi:c-type cytochrome [Flavobacterium sp. HXWNR69]|jgi:cytochrome c|uniref:C-type cytochrome n=1 Tax=Flavobacterium fragile TaxID=2949085 RepID=A0ABT0TEY2_9FLAO|nr:c-type cytochrome [Flavobacterium sp. HXWNR69]MCL9769536.1 c-type cytochrome [Flavobacterium sp. HXWNR69]
MKQIVKSIVVFALAISVTNCGDKKETDKYGNAVEENTETTTETSVDPLLAKGQELFEGKGTCTACHKPDAKVVGPSIKEIAKIYKEKEASIAAFINEESKPIVDPSQYDTMKTNFAITKAMTAEERKALEVYMMSFE